jgi:hypothetical protein
MPGETGSVAFGLDDNSGVFYKIRVEVKAKA